MRLRSALTALAMSAAIVVAGCNASDILDHASEAPLPRDVRSTMAAKGMTKSSPIMMRIFKEEAELEVWKQTDTGRFELVKTYEICAYSGDKGPKFKEGDRQAPEGFYFVNRNLLNPNSSYHLAFNLGFPNKFDQSLGRTGSFLMVHGDCSSRGCYAMTDKYMTEIYAFARDALRGGRQSEFQVQAFPFRMTPENMAEHRNDPHFGYWQMLKSGYDHFELTRTPPKVDVCDRRYVFNMLPTEEGAEFVATELCPPKAMPEPLAAAYAQLKQKHALEFEMAVARLEGRDPSAVAIAQSTPADASTAPDMAVSAETVAAIEEIPAAPMADAFVAPVPDTAGAVVAPMTPLPAPLPRPVQ